MPKKWTKSGPMVTRERNRMATEAQIVKLISENPAITTRLMAELMGRARSGISEHLKRMQADGVIKYEAQDGKWKIL